MIGYIYLIIDLLTGKKYVGQHHYYKPELDPNYHGSGRIIKRLYRKRPETLKMEYIKTCYTQEELDEWEKYFIFIYDTLHPNGYNLTEGGNGGVLCEESRRKIGEANKGKLKGEKNPFYGKTHSEETRRKISESLKGLYASEKHPNYGKKASDETRRKLSEAHKGKTTWNKGMKLSDEYRKKLSEAHKGQISHNKGKPMSEEQKKKLSKKFFNLVKPENLSESGLHLQNVKETDL